MIRVSEYKLVERVEPPTLNLEGDNINLTRWDIPWEETWPFRAAMVREAEGLRIIEAINADPEVARLRESRRQAEDGRRHVGKSETRDW